MTILMSKRLFLKLNEQRVKSASAFFGYTQVGMGINPYLLHSCPGLPINYYFAFDYCSRKNAHLCLKFSRFQ